MSRSPSSNDDDDEVWVMGEFLHMMKFCWCLTREPSCRESLELERSVSRFGRNILKNSFESRVDLPIVESNHGMRIKRLRVQRYQLSACDYAYQLSSQVKSSQVKFLLSTHIQNSPPLVRLVRVVHAAGKIEPPWCKVVRAASEIYTSLPRRKARTKDTQHHKILGSRIKESPIPPVATS